MTEKDHYEMLIEEKEAQSLDEHHLQEGAKLAKGVVISPGGEQIHIPQVGSFHFKNCACPIEGWPLAVKAYIAAQLTQQVFEGGGGVRVHTGMGAVDAEPSYEQIPGHVTVYDREMQPAYRVEGGGIMNTIIAIVDSEVLHDV